MDIHEKVYIPEYSIQGEDIPLSITWDKSKTITINISFSENIMLKEIYNIDGSDLNVNRNSLYLNNFEVNGYLGLALQTRSQDESTINEEIVVRINHNGEEKIINKTITLFRPDIKLIYKPEEINIIKNGNELEIQNKIVIKNCGNGTGLIRLKEKDDSQLKMVDLGGLEEFTKKVIGEFIERLKKLKIKYPQYSDLIEEFINTRKEYMQLDRLDKMKDIVQKITKAFEANRDFMEDFISVLVVSYISNLSIIISLEGFIKYIKSINIGRMILSNPISVFRITPSNNILNAELTIADLAYNIYEPIELSNIKIKSNVDCEVPIYLLFEFENNSGD